MAADFNLTNQYISASFDNLMQNSGSIPVNGLGTEISNLTVTSSFATTASYALNANNESASHAINADTASFFAEGIVTASAVASTITFTKDNGTTFDIIVAQSGSVDSASYAAFAATAESASHAVQADSSSTAVSSSYALVAGTATSASHAVNSDSSISASHALNSDNSISSSYALTATSASHAVRADGSGTAEDLIITVKNVSSDTIAAGVPVYANGVTGENINVVTASNDSSATMPAIGITQNSINASGNGIVVINGRESGIDTSGLAAGQPVYVGLNGTLTATKPTGSALIQNIGTAAKIDAATGEIILQGSGRSNDLPNITPGYLWVGNGDSVPTAVTSESLWTGKNISVNQITASGASFTSASIGYLRTITGSATIIGDEYIILNADSPTKRFAGIKVYDSGSGLTGSFEWDSIDDNWIQVETGGTSAGMLTGISGSKGSEVYPSNNTIIKGTGNHTVQDSIITDNGTQVTVAGNLSASAFIGDGSGLTNISPDSSSYALSASFAQTASYVTPLVQDVIVTGSVTISGSSGYELTTQGDVNFNLTQPAASSATQIISAPGFTGTAGTNNGKTITINELVYQNYPAFGATYENSYMFSQWDGFGYNYGFDFSAGTGRIQALNIASGSGTNAQRSANFSVLDDTNVSNTPEGDAVARYYGRTMELGLYNSETIAIGNNIAVPQGFTTANTHLTAEDKVLIGSTQDTSYPFKGVTRSFQAGGKPTKDIEFYYTGSTSFIQSGSAVKPAVQITGSLQITGSARNASEIKGNLKQNLASPGNNNQYDLIAVSTTTIDGLNYTNVNNFFADYSSFGSGYKDYFATEYYDSFGYNYGGEISVNGVQARMLVDSDNNQFGDIKISKKKPSLIESGRGTVSGSHVLMQAGGTGSQAMINAYNGASVNIQATGTQGGSAGYMYLLSTGSMTLHTQADSLTLKSGTSTGGFYLNVTGSVAQPTASINIGANTGSLENYKTNFFSLTLVSGSDTHLKMQTTYAGRPGQTLSVEVKQPTTATDSYGTLSFAPEFKFAGGTAPTITAASGAIDVLTFQTYDGSTYYGTALQNFS